MPSRPQSPSGQSQRYFVQFLIASIVLTFAWLTYWAYSVESHSPVNGWQAILQGQSTAPMQYRIGVFFVANALTHLSHIPLRYTLTLLDVSFLLLGVLALVRLLRLSLWFRTAQEPARSVAPILALLLLTFYLVWITFWYHKPETLANFGCITLAALLLSGRSSLPRPAALAGLVILAVYLATIRADSGISLMAGIFLLAILPGQRPLPLGRIPLLAVSVLGAFLILATEFYIKNILFPNRPFSDTLFMLPRNLRSPFDLFCVAASLSPYFLTLWLAHRRWRTLESWEQTLILASLVEFAFFFIVAIAGEVRLFLPYAMALIPTSAALLCHRFYSSPTNTTHSKPFTGHSERSEEPL